MLLTPTYHVFKMYSVHQNAQLLPTELENADYSYNEDKIPQISLSSSLDSDGRIHISICNLDPNKSAELDLELIGSGKTKVTGTILTSDQMNAKNTFDSLNTVTEAVYDGACIDNNHITAVIPAKSVVVLEIE
jgi:alpha-N-arabinofuranosidase